METRKLRQLRGGIELVSDGVDAATTAAARVHLAIAARPYAILGQFGVIAAPVRVIEQMQGAITRGVYRAVGIGNQVVRRAALEHLQRQAHRARATQDPASN